MNHLFIYSPDTSTKYKRVEKENWDHQRKYLLQSINISYMIRRKNAAKIKLEASKFGSIMIYSYESNQKAFLQTAIHLKLNSIYMN
jgi:hypothetical protein